MYSKIIFVSRCVLHVACDICKWSSFYLYTLHTIKSFLWTSVNQISNFYSWKSLLTALCQKYVWMRICLLYGDKFLKLHDHRLTVLTTFESHMMWIFTLVWEEGKLKKTTSSLEPFLSFFVSSDDSCIKNLTWLQICSLLDPLTPKPSPAELHSPQSFQSLVAFAFAQKLEGPIDDSVVLGLRKPFDSKTEDLFCKKISDSIYPLPCQ